MLLVCPMILYSVDASSAIVVSIPPSHCQIYTHAFQTKQKTKQNFIKARSEFRFHANITSLEKSYLHIAWLRSTYRSNIFLANYITSTVLPQQICANETYIDISHKDALEIYIMIFRTLRVHRLRGEARCVHDAYRGWTCANGIWRTSITTARNIKITRD